MYYLYHKIKAEDIKCKADLWSPSLS